MQIFHACVKLSSLHRQYLTFRLSKNTPLTALRNDSSSDSDALFIFTLLLALGEALTLRDEEDCVILPPSIALESDVCHFCRAISNSIKTNYMLDDGLKRHDILKTKSAEFDKIKKTLGAHIPGEMRTFTSADSTDDEDENALKYTMQIMKTLRYGSALTDHILSPKKVFIVMLLRNLNSKTGYMTGTRYAVENLRNNVLFHRSANGIRKGAKQTLA